MRFMKTLLAVLAILGSNPLVATITAPGTGSQTVIADGVTITGGVTAAGNVDLGTSTTQVTVAVNSDCGTGNVCSGTWAISSDSCNSCIQTAADKAFFMRVGGVISYGFRLRLTSSSSPTFSMQYSNFPNSQTHTDCHGTIVGGQLVDSPQCKIFRNGASSISVECSTQDGTNAAGGDMEAHFICQI